MVGLRASVLNSFSMFGTNDHPWCSGGRKLSGNSLIRNSAEAKIKAIYPDILLKAVHGGGSQTGVQESSADGKMKGAEISFRKRKSP